MGLWGAADKSPGPHLFAALVALCGGGGRSSAGEGESDGKRSEGGMLRTDLSGQVRVVKLRHVFAVGDITIAPIPKIARAVSIIGVSKNPPAKPGDFMV